MTVQDDDQLLVCRNSTPYNLKTQNLMAELLDDDLMLVCRNGSPYKATGLEIKESIGPQEAPPSLTSVTLTEDSPGGDRFDNQSFTSTLNWATKGVPEASLEMKATVTGTLDIAGTTDDITDITQTGAPSLVNIDVTVSPPVDTTGTLATTNSTAIFATAPSNPFGLTQCYEYDGDGTKYNTFTGDLVFPGEYTIDYYIYDSGLSASGRPIDIGGSRPLDDFGFDDRKIRLRSLDNSTTDYSYSTNKNTWYHIRITPTGIWINGVLKHTSIRNISGYAATYLNQGRYAETTSYPWVGFLGPVRIATVDLGAPPVGGLVLVDGKFPASGSTLTLASDVNLANGVFKAGDVVKQDNSPIIPTSSAITNVAAAPSITFPSFSISGGYNVYGDGPCYGENEPIPANGYGNVINIKQNQGGNIDISPPIDGNGSVIEILFYYSGAAGYMEYQDKDDNIVRVDNIQNLYDDAKPAAKWFSTGVTSLKKIISVGMYTGDLGWWGLRCNGASWFNRAGGTVVSSSDKTLSLQNASGLSGFEVGDVVQSQVASGVTTQVPVDNSGDPIATTAEWTDILGVDPSDTSGPSVVMPDGGGTVAPQGRIYFAGMTVGDTITWFGTATDGPRGCGGNVEETSVILPGNSLGSFQVTVTAPSGYFKVDWNGSGNICYGLIPSTTANATTVQAIDLVAPSITTDGGTWNVGEVVTGPSTDITATFVSADPSVPSMTVSDVVGPWSANTGNYVANTVVNPVLIKPETSAIANVTATSFPTYSWSYGEYNGGPTANASAPASDAGYTGVGSVDIKQSVGTIAVTPVINPGLGEIEIYARPSGNVTSLKFKNASDDDVLISGLDSVLSDSEWRWVSVPGLESIKSIENTSADDLWIAGIRAGGIFIGPDYTSLGLTDDTDLAQFATGDAVYAAGVAPATFAPVTYTGNAGTQSITTGIAPDLVWIKALTETTDHNLFDTVRGPEKRLFSNTTAVESASNITLTSFNADGFTISSANDVNKSGADYVAWCWSAGGTTVTNNEGTIQSQVRSSGDFSIVTYTGNGANTQSVGIGLSSDAKMMIVKAINNNIDWCVWHEGLQPYGYLRLNSSVGEDTDPLRFSASPSSSVMFVGDNSEVNYNSSTEYIAYCWAESPTQSFGSYTGNGSTTGPVIDCGFEPAFVMIKRTDVGDSWAIYDSARDPVNPRDKLLTAQSSAAENQSSSLEIDFNSNGFQPKMTDTTANASGGTYIYAAFAGGGGPTGVVGDITDLDMTLSESTGTWEVGQKVTMDEKPAVETTANLIFDSTGAVTGLSTQPVAGQLMSNKDTPKLTFGDGAGTGETWDEELPAGTHLQTSFVATNVEGTSSATSNEITP